VLAQQRPAAWSSLDLGERDGRVLAVRYRRELAFHRPELRSHDDPWSEESREWRLLLLEFVAHAARTENLGIKLQALRRRYREALAEVLEQRLVGTSQLAADDLALVAVALADGFAVEELAAPGSAPEGLVGDALARLMR
jgi:hypothetical protein